jgi:hypothetical protein
VKFTLKREDDDDEEGEERQYKQKGKLRVERRN